LKGAARWIYHLRALVFAQQARIQAELGDPLVSASDCLSTPGYPFLLNSPRAGPAQARRRGAAACAGRAFTTKCYQRVTLCVHL
jgi:hypothetical protein